MKHFKNMIHQKKKNNKLELESLNYKCYKLLHNLKLIQNHIYLIYKKNLYKFNILYNMSYYDFDNSFHCKCIL